jgi:hypothetical protein
MWSGHSCPLLLPTGTQPLSCPAGQPLNWRPRRPKLPIIADCGLEKPPGRKKTLPTTWIISRTFARSFTISRSDRARQLSFANELCGVAGAGVPVANLEGVQLESSTRAFAEKGEPASRVFVQCWLRTCAWTASSDSHFRTHALRQLFGVPSDLQDYVFAKGASNETVCGVNSSAPFSMMCMSSSMRIPNSPRI